MIALLAALLACAAFTDAAAWANPLSVVVMGDSYSAGNGAGDYYGPAGCRRSSRDYAEDYAELLSRTPADESARVTNVACSGATTNAFFTSYNHQPPQIKALRADDQLIFLTIGGNDVHFADIVKYCLIHKTQHGSTCLGKLDRAVKLLGNGTITAAVSKILRAINTAAPHAKVVILGYPFLEGNARYTIVDRGEGSRSDAGTPCGTRRGSTNLVHVGQCLHTIGLSGNTVQHQVVNTLNHATPGAPFQFVSTEALFAGTQPGFLGPNHELFASHVNPARWFIQPFVDADRGLGTIKALDPSTVAVFYHPNPTGWQKEAELLMRQVHLAATPDAESAAEQRVNSLSLECLQPDYCTQVHLDRYLPVFLSGMDTNLTAYLASTGYTDRWTTDGDAFYDSAGDATSTAQAIDPRF